MEADAMNQAGPSDGWVFTDAEQGYEEHDTDGLDILPRDPNTMYVYWEVTEERKRMAERHFGVEWEALRKGLRLYDVNAIRFDGDVANRAWDIDLRQSATQWFIGGLSPDCRYIVDFGVRTEEGGFLTLLRSGSAQLPPDRPFADGALREEGRLLLPNQGDPDWLDRFTGYSLLELLSPTFVATTKKR